MYRRMICALGLIVFAAGLVRGDSADPRPLFVEGYAGKVSYNPGESLTLHVSTSAAKLAVEIARLGATKEVVLTKADVAGRAIDRSMTRLRRYDRRDRYPPCLRVRRFFLRRTRTFCRETRGRRPGPVSS